MTRGPPMAVLTALFLLSGIAGLTYQVVWFRLLFRAFGVGVYAVTTIIAIFMGGLAIGSLIAGRIAKKRSGSLLHLYAGAELLVAILAIISTQIMDALPRLSSDLVVSSGLEGASLVAFRIVAASAVLLPPTIVMGTTLPLLSGHLARQPSAVGLRVGMLYGINTLGAVIGVLFTGFVSIAIWGEQTTVFIAVALNVTVGLGSLAIARGSTTDVETPAPTGLSPKIRRILIVAMISGFCALSLEVVWSRLLTLLLGNSVYGFSSMLGAYLIGIGIGSTVMARFIDRVKHPLLWFGVFEIANAILGLASLRIFRMVGLDHQDKRYIYSLIWSTDDFVRLALDATLIVMPVTLIYGAIFPIISRLVADMDRTEGAIGKLYGLNTIGGIIGSFVTGLVLIPAVGTLMTFLIVSTISLAIGVYLVSLTEHPKKRMWQLGGALAMVALLAVSFEDPFLSVLLHRVEQSNVKLLAHEEDRGVTVTSFRDENGAQSLFINGLYVSNTFPGVGELMLNTPMAFHPEEGKRKVLAIGLGVGEHLRYAVRAGHDMTIVELHPAVVGLFRNLNDDADEYLNHENVRIVQGDGRNFLLHTDEKFDLILVDVSPPIYAQGMVNLYSLEFQRLARDHLTDNGIFTVWFPAVCFERDFWSVMRNFAETYESIGLYGFPGQPNAMIMGSKVDDALDYEFERFRQRYDRRRLWKRNDPRTIARGFRFDEAALRDKAKDYPIVTDDLPYTEYPLQPFLRGEKYYNNNRFLLTVTRTSTTTK